MRKRFHMIAAAAFALTIVAGGCAKEISPPQHESVKKETSGTAKTTAPRPKPHGKLFTGTIEALDEAEGTMTLRGPKGTMDFQVHEKVKDQLDALNIGDKVIVKHVDEIALAIVKPRTSKSALILDEKRVL